MDRSPAAPAATDSDAPLLKRLAVRTGSDVVAARRAGRDIPELLGFREVTATRIATSISELARDALERGGGGRVDFHLRLQDQMLEIRVADRGQEPSAERNDNRRARRPTVFGNAPRSREDTLALIRGWVDECSSGDAPSGGLRICFAVRLPAPRRQWSDDAVAKLRERVGDLHGQDPYEELQRQNGELFATLDALREREAERDELLETTRQALGARDEVLAIVSHDLRNPVGTMLTSTQLLLEGLDEDPVARREQLAVIERLGRRAIRLIEDLLQVSSLDAGVLALERKEMTVGELLDGVRESWNDPNGQGRVDVRAAADVAGTSVSVDPGRLVQALGNLVGNAVKFSPEDTRVQVAADVVDDAVVFSVTDEGPGMGERELARIYDKFWQGDPGDDRGVGLGLSIARQIVLSHGGSMDVTSEPGRGTTFTLTFPLTPPEPS